MKIRTYSELIKFETFNDRFDYLKLNGSVGKETFGFDRHINQNFYSSREWKDVRNQVIVRDNGCDLGVKGHEVNGAVLIHHITPIGAEDILHSDELLLNTNNLITTTHDTHNAIHYGNISLLRKLRDPRRPGDTKLW